MLEKLPTCLGSWSLLNTMGMWAVKYWDGFCWWKHNHSIILQNANKLLHYKYIILLFPPRWNATHPGLPQQYVMGILYLTQMRRNIAEPSFLSKETMQQQGLSRVFNYGCLHRVQFNMAVLVEWILINGIKSRMFELTAQEWQGTLKGRKFHSHYYCCLLSYSGLWA